MMIEQGVHMTAHLQDRLRSALTTVITPPGHTIQLYPAVRAPHMRGRLVVILVLILNSILILNKPMLIVLREGIHMHPLTHDERLEAMVTRISLEKTPTPPIPGCSVTREYGASYRCLDCYGWSLVLLG